jgi:hypothetical protein
LAILPRADEAAGQDEGFVRTTSGVQPDLVVPDFLLDGDLMNFRESLGTSARMQEVTATVRGLADDVAVDLQVEPLAAVGTLLQWRAHL